MNPGPQPQMPPQTNPPQSVPPKLSPQPAPQSIYPEPTAGRLSTTILPPGEPSPVVKQTAGMFSGRLNRIGYLLATVYLCLLSVIPLAIIYASPSDNGSAGYIILVLMLMAALFFAPVSLGLSMRRWHDLNQSGWFVLLSIIPFVGIVVQIVLYFIPGTKGPNDYGDPDNHKPTPGKVLFGK